MYPTNESESSPAATAAHFVEIPAEPTASPVSSVPASNSPTHYVFILVSALVIFSLGFFFGQYKRVLWPAAVASQVKHEDAKPVAVNPDTAPPVSQEELLAIPGEKRQQFETQCVTQAMDKAKELGVDVNAFFKLNRNYVNHCVVHLAKDGTIR